MDEELTCQACSHGFGAHSMEEAPGGHCRAAVANSPAYRLPCPCPGFRWLPVVPAGPAPAYGDRPAPAYG